MENINTRDGRLNTIAQKHVEVGNLDQIYCEIDAHRNDQVLELMVKAYTRDKDLGNALALAKLIASDNTRQTRFYYIAQTQVQAGELQAAAPLPTCNGDLRDRILQGNPSSQDVLAKIPTLARR